MIFKKNEMAIRICSTPALFEEESEKIRIDLLLNGYGDRLIRQVKQELAGTPRDRRQWDSSISIPYVPNKSEAIRRILNTANIRVAFSSDNSVGRALSKVKDEVPYGAKGNLIYKISCKDCASVYIGETSRALSDRAREHSSLSKKKIPRNMDEWRNLETSSAIALHAIEANHRVDFDAPVILSSNWQLYRERIAAESWFISGEPTACNTQKKAVHPAWNLLR